MEGRIRRALRSLVCNAIESLLHVSAQQYEDMVSKIRFYGRTKGSRIAKMALAFIERDFSTEEGVRHGAG